MFDGRETEEFRILLLSHMLWYFYKIMKCLSGPPCFLWSCFPLAYIIFFNPIVSVKLKAKRKGMIQKLWERIIKELYSFR
ncbi:Uncharacterized protein APZ42_018717 [Daphnia magna]|uniref:Uncharacterized protein n=1 Tax=Daphnia magna TaxID=35525 RepID=A0A0P4Y6S9_9CRUS|nr:Uncharacterized protein APZ42_018717 [Daphnia magna]